MISVCFVVSSIGRKYLLKARSSLYLSRASSGYPPPRGDQVPLELFLLERLD
jgi:hypothetical protein